mmetsp:Transcript_104883/g.293984  ORF Transcript_104883/g.293984 Transcript_104883/m.293984 type:complete len:296 (-) Transcript_104883:1037-1924(-)
MVAPERCYPPRLEGRQLLAGLERHRQSQLPRLLERLRHGHRLEAWSAAQAEVWDEDVLGARVFQHELRVAGRHLGSWRHRVRHRHRPLPLQGRGGREEQDRQGPEPCGRPGRGLHPRDAGQERGAAPHRQAGIGVAFPLEVHLGGRGGDREVGGELQAGGQGVWRERRHQGATPRVGRPLGAAPRRWEAEAVALDRQGHGGCLRGPRRAKQPGVQVRMVGRHEGQQGAVDRRIQGRRPQGRRGRRVVVARPGQRRCHPRDLGGPQDQHRQLRQGSGEEARRVRARGAERLVAAHA